MAGAGVRGPSIWQAQFLGGNVGLGLEVGIHAWSAQQGAGRRQHTVQAVAMPIFRWRGDGGGSPWFLEAGVGLSYHNKEYEAKSAHQSTRWNFNDVIGVGRSFRSHEVGLRLSHFSNAGVQHPNPGDTRLALRWGYHY